MSLAFLTLSLLCAPPAQAQSGYPGGGGSGSGYPGGGSGGSSGGGSGGGYPGGGSWCAVHCDAKGNDIPNDPSSGPYPLQGTQSVTNVDTYTHVNNDSSDSLVPAHPLGNYTHTMPALEGDNSSGNNFEYGIGFDGYFDQTRAGNCVTDDYGYWVGIYPHFDSSGQYVIAGPWNGKVQHDATGQILAYFQWRYLNSYTHQPMPAPAGSLPPDHIDLLLRTRLAAATYVTKGAIAEASATDGDPFEETAGAGQTVTGLHLVRASTDSNNVGETYLNGSVHMLAQNDILFNPNGEAEASAWAFVSASAGQDSSNREVTISADIEPTWKKGKVSDRVGYPVQDQWGNDVYEPVENQPDPDGTGHGDVGLAASPQHVLVPTPSDSFLYVTYKGNYAGSWHIPIMEWWYSSLTGYAANGLIDSLDASSFVVSYFRPSDSQVIGYDPYDGTPLYSQALPGKTGTDHVHLTCEDAAPYYGSGGDGAFATANYYMNVHDEWENPFKFRPDEFFWKDVRLNTPVPEAHYNFNPIITVAGQADGATTPLGDMISNAEWTVGFNAMPGWLQGILKVAGISDDLLKPASLSGDVPFDGVWHSAIDIGATWDNSSTKPDDSMEPFYKMVPRLQKYFTRTWTRQDHYVMPGDSSGYTGYAGYHDQPFEARATQPAGTRGTGDFFLDTTLH